MVSYHCDSDTILKAPFSSRKDKHRIRAYSSIMKRLADRGHKVGVQILDNEVSAEYKRVIVDDWGATYQLVPPNIHQRNTAERSIRTFKAHFYQSCLECGTNCWFKQSSHSTSSAKPRSTHSFQHGNISMAHLTMQQLRWVPLDVKLSSTPCQTISYPGIKEDVKDLV